MSWVIKSPSRFVDEVARRSPGLSREMAAFQVNTHLIYLYIEAKEVKPMILPPKLDIYLEFHLQSLPASTLLTVVWDWMTTPHGRLLVFYQDIRMAQLDQPVLFGDC